MMKKLLFIVCFYVFLQGCSDKAPDVVTANQQEVFSFFPSGTQFILYMNLTELRKTEFWSDYFQPSITNDTANNWLSDFEEFTGTGLQKGISEIITATTWDGNDVFAIRFEDNYASVHSYFQDDNKFLAAEVEGKQVYSLKDNSNAKFYFPSDDLLLILKDESYLTSMIKGEHSAMSIEDELFEVIKKIKNKKHYWMASNKGGFAAGLLGLLSGSTDLPVNSLISSVNNISLSAVFDDGVDIKSVWGCTDSKNAHLLSTTVRSAVAMDLLAGKDNALNQLMKKLEIDRDEKDVYFELNINKEQLAGIKELAGKKKITKTL